MPLAVGPPVWVDDPHFSLDYHLRHTAIPKPGSEEQLRQMAARIFSQHLDRDKPLWELWAVEGLQRKHWALRRHGAAARLSGLGTRPFRVTGARPAERP